MKGRPEEGQKEEGMNIKTNKNEIRNEKTAEMKRKELTPEELNRVAAGGPTGCFEKLFKKIAELFD